MLIALLLIPIIGSGLVFAWKNSTAKYAALAIAIVEMLVSFYMISQVDFSVTIDNHLHYEIITGESSFLKTSLHMGVDGLSMLFVILTTILTVLIILSSFARDISYSKAFYGLALMMQFGLIGVFCSLDGLVFYGFWEITLIPIWFICGLWGDKEQRLHFTVKFFVYTFLGSMFMLGGLIYTYIHSQSFALMDLYNAQLNVTQQNFVFWFIFAAFAVKLPIFPFHSWQPDTYTYSSTEGSMLLSGLMVKMAVFGLLRFLLPIVPMAVMGTSGKIVLILAIIGVVYGAIIAIVDNDAKRIITFSSLSHIGLITAGIFAAAILTLNGTFTTEGGEGAVIQSFAHGVNIIGLFFCADILMRRFKTRNIKEMGGFVHVAPKFGIFFMIIVFGTMAVPLMNGFPGEFMLLKSLADYSTGAVIAGGLTMILCTVYMLRFFGKVMYGKGDQAVLSKLSDIGGVEITVLTSLAVLVVVVGVFPNLILDMVRTPIRFIFNSMVF